jgi:hypothetical protein
MNKNAVVGVGALLVAMLIWAWAFGWFEGKDYSDDPIVAELERQRDENLPKLAQMNSDQQRSQRDVMRKQMEGLTPEQRMDFFERSMPVFMPLMAGQFEQRYDQFMKMSPEEQRKELDKRIDEMEKRGASGNGRGGPPNIDAKKAESFRKKMLDWTTPEQRAKFEHGMQLMNDRREQRGLGPMPGPGGGVF